MLLGSPQEGGCSLDEEGVLANRLTVTHAVEEVGIYVAWKGTAPTET